LLAIGAMLAFAGPASAHHHDFGSDDNPAGTISSFDPETGVLAIDLADGGQISGLVTDETRIETDRGCRHGHGRHHGWDHGSEGDTDDLVAGAVVDDAILVLEDGKAIFAKVELVDSGSAEPPTATAKTSKAGR
jgi:hypothetical protein